MQDSVKTNLYANPYYTSNFSGLLQQHKHKKITLKEINCTTKYEIKQHIRFRKQKRRPVAQQRGLRTLGAAIC